MHDYHIHTTLCKHAHNEMEEYINSALQKGISDICFTDHIPLPDNFDISHRMEPDEMETYLENIRKCKERFPHASIGTGIEADYLSIYEDYLKKFFKKYSFDLVIMAVHFVEHWPEGNWVFNYNFPDKTQKEIYHDYFQFMNKGICSGHFDVVGHMDLIKRPGHPVMKTNREDVEMIFDSLIKHNMGIEINTSGLRREINEPYPSLDIIEAAVQRGIPITLASDAHKPHHIGHCFPEIMEHISRFKGLELLNVHRD